MSMLMLYGMFWSLSQFYAFMLLNEMAVNDSVNVHVYPVVGVSRVVLFRYRASYCGCVDVNMHTTYSHHDFCVILASL